MHINIKDSAFTEINQDVKGVPFVNRGYTKGVPFAGLEKILVQ